MNKYHQYHLTHDEISTPIFTAEELARFNKRFEEGYDLTTDERYNLWLLTRDITLPKPNTSITPFLDLPMVKFPDTSKHKASGRVITSVDFRRQLMEKQKKKEQESEMKALRMAERERKKLEKLEKMKESVSKKGTINRSVVEVL